MFRLEKTGAITHKHSRDVRSSRLGIGFEKLDRDVFDPEKAYDKVAATGVKWIRLQSGWARTEKEKGVYDFSWLDSIVDNLISRGLVPWLCLCYGNGLYDEKAKEIFGAVGCPPVYTDEQQTAWISYVKATVAHFSGRIEYYEVWNEPDGIWCWKQGVNASEYGRLVDITAKAVKAADADAKVIAGSFCHRDLAFINEALSCADCSLIDAVTFHEYTPDESLVFSRVKSLRALTKTFDPNIEIIQGESGSQSKYGGAGALKGGSWTPLKQAKQLLRHGVADLISDVKFSSYFSTMDMIEALNGKVGDKASYMDYGYFGILAADFDENGFSTGEYTPKPSYYALQNLAALFAEDFEVCELPILKKWFNTPLTLSGDCTAPTLISGGFKRENGAAAFAYWNSTDLMTTTYEGTVSFEVAAMHGEVRLVDPMDGSIYKIPENMVEDKGFGCYVLKNLPIRDYPLILTFGNF